LAYSEYIDNVFDCASFSMCSAIESKFLKCSFKKSELSLCDFSRSLLVDTSFVGALLHRVSMQNAVKQNTMLSYRGILDEDRNLTKAELWTTN